MTEKNTSVRGAATSWLVGGGEMGDLIRAKDWSSTSLGPGDSWPQSLRTTASLVVESKFPMALLWGPELLLIYNDAYKVIAADKHPSALGRSTRNVWAEVWQINQPIFAAVMERGETLYFEDKLFPIDRLGRREEAYFTLSYSPVRVEDGRIGGTLVTLQETTHQRRAGESLREREGRFRAVHENSLDRFTILKPFRNDRGEIVDFTYVYQNARAAETAGHPPEELVGRRVTELFPTFPRTRFFEIYRQVVGAGQTQEFEERYNCDGVDEWFRAVVTPVPGGIAVATQIITERKRADEALRESEALLRSLTDNSPDAIYVKDRQSRWLMANPAVLRIVGRTAEDALGKTDAELYADPAIGQRILENDRHIMSQGQAVAVEEVVDTPEGRRTFLSIKSPRRDAQGCVTGIVGISRDVTDRKRTEEALRETERRYRELVRLAPAGIYEVDFRSGRFTSVNDAMSEILGYSREELLAMSAVDILDDESRGRFRQRLVNWLAGEKPEASVEYKVRTKDGRIIDGLLAVSFTKDESGRPLGATVVAHDITDRKRVEEALRQSREALREANDRLLEADRRKNEFLAVLSHELRNPLAPITNSLYILDHAVPGGDQAERAKQVIGRQVGQLSNLVNDLLDVTRITRNKVQLQKERLELNEVVRRTVEDNRSSFDRAGVDLEVAPAACPAPVTADRTRVAQIVSNLLQNSAKFTPKGGRTRVSVSVEGPEAVVRVADDGVGIPPRTLERLFQPFTQAEQTLDRSNGGLGLGLALVKGLVELHGGSVSAHSEGLGRGTEMIVRLPLDTSVTLEAFAASTHQPPARRRVLIIEDNADGADSLSEALALGEHEVAVAYDGPNGIAKAKEFHPEVVLCDIGLPGMDGYSVARAFRADEGLRDVVLVALTGYALPEDVAKVTEAGFDRHLAKPVDAATLEQALGAAQPPARADARTSGN